MDDRRTQLHQELAMLLGCTSQGGTFYNVFCINGFPWGWGWATMCRSEKMEEGRKHLRLIIYLPNIFMARKRCTHQGVGSLGCGNAQTLNLSV